MPEAPTLELTPESPNAAALAKQAWSLVEIAEQKYIITLVSDGLTWIWRRDDGKWVSPIFSTAEAAHYFAGKIPYLSDEEWKQFNPLPAATFK